MAATTTVRARIVILAAGLVDTGRRRPCCRAGSSPRTRRAHIRVVRGRRSPDARQTAQALLGSGGIQTEWRQCVGNDGCAESPAGRPFVRVHLLPMTKMLDSIGLGRCETHIAGTDERAGLRPEKCGNRSDAAPKSRGPRESIVVWADDGACRRRHDRARGRPPAGAFLGSVGVMKPRLRDDLVASRSSAFVFLPDERDRMLRALQRGANDDNARHRRPHHVVARIHEHGSVAGQPIILVVGHDDFSEPVWRRVKDLVAFRLHRRRGDRNLRRHLPGTNVRSV